MTQRHRILLAVLAFGIIILLVSISFALRWT